MKIAVQLFGHLRTFEECAPSLLDHLINKYDCDVFIHTWSMTEHNTVTWHNNKSRCDKVDKSMIKKIIDLYHPKCYEIEDQNPDLYDDVLIPCEHNYGQNKISSRGIKFMIHSKNMVNSLRKKFQQENNITYDYVIMIRPDIKLYRDFDLRNYDRQIRCLNLKDGRYGVTNTTGNHDFSLIGSGASDILYFGKPEIIDRTVEALNNLDFNNVPKQQFWCPEAYFLSMLQKYGIESYFIDFKYEQDWKIIRSKNKKIAFKDFLKIRINRKIISVIVLGLCNSVFFNLEVSVFGRFKILVRVGNADKKL